MNGSYEGMCVEFEQKNTQHHWFTYFQIVGK